MLFYENGSDNNDAGNKYKNIINLPHKQSKKRAHMSVHDRAAQFAPFSALTGYEEAVEETARLTDKKRILSENEAEELNVKLNFIAEHLKQNIEAAIIYFKADEKKSGGAYLTVKGIVKKIDVCEHILTMQNGETIFIDDIDSITISEFNLVDD